MYFEQLSTKRGCQSYIIGCQETKFAVVVDPEISLIDEYLTIASKNGLRLKFLIDTHTHADHFSASREVSHLIDAPIVMHQNTSAQFVDLKVSDGEKLKLGNLQLDFIHTPGHTSDSMCIILPDRVLTGDTLLIGGAGRTDLPSGDPEDLYDSLFNGLLRLNLELKVYPGHDYKRIGHTTLEKELTDNPRLKNSDKSRFIEMMNALNLNPPKHLTEALRTNINGGKSCDQLISEASKAISFITVREVNALLEASDPNIILLDVREQSAYDIFHLPEATHVPRGELEFRVNSVVPNSSKKIVVYCETGKCATLATYTLIQMGFDNVVAMEGGIQLWKKNNYSVK